MKDEGQRLDRFRRQHPDVTVERVGRFGSEVWRAHRDGVVLVVKIRLSDLLDALERMAGSARG